MATELMSLQRTVHTEWKNIEHMDGSKAESPQHTLQGNSIFEDLWARALFYNCNMTLSQEF